MDREWVTILECISAAGSRIRPTVMFKRKTLQRLWFEEQTPDWIYKASDKGWTNNSIGLGWLEEGFIPDTASKTAISRGRHILILDGHASHTDPRFMESSHSNKIYCLYLPPQTSHVLQPLYVGVFSALKGGYTSAIQTMTNQENAPLAEMQSFVQCYAQVRHNALTSRNVRGAFKATGIWPIDRDKGLHSPFCASYIAPRPTTPPQQLMT